VFILICVVVTIRVVCDVMANVTGFVQAVAMANAHSERVSVVDMSLMSIEQLHMQVRIPKLTIQTNHVYQQPIPL
jgi:hypothetical protein